MNDWFDHILYNTRTQRETPAVVMEDRVVTYGMLGQAIESCAQRVATLDAIKGGLVGICIQNPIRHLVICLALYRIGVRSISLASQDRHLIALDITLFLGDKQVEPIFAQTNRFIEITDDWFTTKPETIGPLPQSFSDERQVFRISLTSGSTGEPKIVENTVGDLGRDIISGLMSFNCDRVLTLMRSSSVFGLKIACGTLASKKTLCFAQSPFQAIRMIELFSVDFVLVSTDQLVSLVRAARKTGAQLRSLRTAVAGGGVPTRALLEAAAIHLCKDIRSRYGTSEVGLLAMARASEILAKPGLVGTVLPGFEICVVDHDGGILPPGQMGIVKARVKRSGDAWTNHEDVGWIAEDGQIFIVGRTSDITDFSNSAARGISPAYEVEHLVRLEWDASDAGAVVVDAGSSEVQPEIWVGAVDCKDAQVDKLQKMLRERGIDNRVRLIAVPSVPRGANGKIQRGALKAMLLAAASHSLQPSIT